MKCRRLVGCLCLGFATIIWPASAHAQVLGGLFGKKAEPSEQVQAAAAVPLEQIPPAFRDKVSQVLARPTLYSRGPQENFECRPDLYRWMLDHPDRTVLAWKRLGAKCVDIEVRGNGWFGWSDGQGSDIAWVALHSTPSLRIWYAEGTVKPGALFPQVPVQCVVVLRHDILSQNADGAMLQQQADVFAYTDSKTASLVTRMLGPSVPRMAKQGVGQLQMFFGAMAWYCQQHPDRTESLLRPETQPKTQSQSPYNPINQINGSEGKSDVAGK